MPAFDPYAPPRDLPPPELPRPALPEGIRRYGLDSDAYRAFVAKELRARIVRSLIFGGLYLAGVGYWTREWDTPFLAIAAPIYVAVLVVLTLVTRYRVRRLIPTALRGFEVLASPRVIRRTAWGFPPAEIAAPEVTSIVEIADGLSIVARTRRLFLSRTIAGYADLRDHARAWHPIEARTGLRAALRKASHRQRGKVYDVARDAAITTDASLAAELEAVRALAMPVDRGAIVRSQWRRVVLALLVIAFLVSIGKYYVSARS